MKLPRIATASLALGCGLFVGVLLGRSSVATEEPIAYAADQPMLAAEPTSQEDVCSMFIELFVSIDEIDIAENNYPEWVGSLLRMVEVGVLTGDDSLGSTTHDLVSGTLSGDITMQEAAYSTLYGLCHEDESPVA